MENPELKLTNETEKPEQTPAETRFQVIDKNGIVHTFTNASEMDQFKKDELAQEN